MAPTKNKDWKSSTFSLELDAKATLKDIAEFENLSQSDMLGFLIRNYNAGMNPSVKLNELLAERTLQANKLKMIDEEIQKLTEHIKKFEAWNKTKATKKDQAIRILQNRILQKDFGEVERLSKMWQGMTGIPAIELIAEASERIQRSGI